MMHLSNSSLPHDFNEISSTTCGSSGQESRTLHHYAQTNIALSVLRGFICQRTDQFSTCAAEHSSGAEFTSDSRTRGGNNHTLA